MFDRIKSMFKISPDPSPMLLRSPFSNRHLARRGTRETLQAYQQSPWLHAVCHRIGESLGQTTWLLFRTPRDISSQLGRDAMRKGVRWDSTARRWKTRSAHTALESQDLEEIGSHPMLDLLDNPNPWHHGWQLLFLAAVHLKLVGEAYWWINDRDQNGAPASLYPLPPHWIQKTPTPDEPYFELSRNGGTRKIKPDDMVWIKHPDPKEPFARGSGQGLALGHEIDTDEEAARYLWSYFKNSAIPEMMVGIEDSTQSEVEAAKNRYLQSHRGTGQSHGVWFYSGSVNVKQLSSSFKDMQLVELRNHLRNTHIQVFGMPPEQLGIIENSNRSTIDASDYLYASKSILPLVVQIWWELQYSLLPQFPGGRRLLVGYVSPVPEDQEFILKAAKAAPQSRTLNEWRDLQGLPPAPFEGGDEQYNPITYNSSASADEGGAPNNTGDEEDGDEEDEERGIMPGADQVSIPDNARLLDWASELMNGH